MEWVEVSGKSVEVAVSAALSELGLTSTDDVIVEVIQQPKGGFLGLGGQDAIVKVTPKPRERGKRRRRRRKGKGDRSEAAGGQAGERSKGSGRPSSGRGRSEGSKRGPSGGRNQKQQRDGSPARASNGGNKKREATINDEAKAERPEADINEQAAVAKEFLVGLLDAFGLEGEVASRVEDDVLYVNVTGGQTEALVGAKGSVMQSVHELTRTVIQRKTFGAPRMRIDIAGYTERRREALRIYTAKLADKVLDEGGEIMLEPMNAADRKVVHDAVVGIEGVRSFSEGADPHRAVVIALEDGVAPRKTMQSEGDDDIEAATENEGSGEEE